VSTMRWSRRQRFHAVSLWVSGSCLCRIPDNSCTSSIGAATTERHRRIWRFDEQNSFIFAQCVDDLYPQIGPKLPCIFVSNRATVQFTTRVCHTCITTFLWSPYVIGQTIIFLPCGFYLPFFFFLYFLA